MGGSGIEKNRKHNTVYQVTNNLNGMIYVGKHSTDNLDDGYMGSSNDIKNAIKEFGKENFTKEILEDFPTSDEAYAREAEIVDEDFVLREDTYNNVSGGKVTSKGVSMYVSKDGALIFTSKDDPRVKSGELVSINTGMGTYKDKNDNIVQADVDDPRVKSGELVSINVGIGTYKDKNGNKIRASTDDPRVKSGELVSINTGIATYKDKNGNAMQVSTDDPRVKSGELIGNRSKKKPYIFPDGSVKFLHEKEVTKEHILYEGENI